MTKTEIDFLTLLISQLAGAQRKMGLADDLKNEVSEVFRTQWTTRDGEVIPEPEDIQLGNHAVRLDGTVLYADLADSTSLVNAEPPAFAAEVFKTFLLCACRIIRTNGGAVTSFDGDRVMAVFIGKSKNTTAANTARQINYSVSQIIQPIIEEQYPSKNFKVRHAAGVDTGNLFIARTGIRNSNDLAWIGRSANYAAKLSSLRNGKTSWITEDVYNQMHDSAKFHEGKSMWERSFWNEQRIYIYGSSWWRGLSS